MPWRRGEGRHKVEFMANARVPFLVTKAREITGDSSGSAYYQRAVLERLARDLELSDEQVEELMLVTSKDANPLNLTHRTPVSNKAG